MRKRERLQRMLSECRATTTGVQGRKGLPLGRQGSRRKGGGQGGGQRPGLAGARRGGNPHHTTPTTHPGVQASKPSALLLPYHQFAKTNPSLSGGSPKPIPNPASAWERLSKLKPGFCEALGEADEPGVHAAEAMANLRGEALATLPGLTLSRNGSRPSSDRISRTPWRRHALGAPRWV